MCFVFPEEAFEDVMTFEYMKSQNYLKNEKSFRIKIKETFFLASQMPFFRLKNKLAKT